MKSTSRHSRLPERLKWLRVDAFCPQSLKIAFIQIQLSSAQCTLHNQPPFPYCVCLDRWNGTCTRVCSSSAFFLFTADDPHVLHVPWVSAIVCSPLLATTMMLEARTLMNRSFSRPQGIRQKLSCDIRQRLSRRLLGGRYAAVFGDLPALPAVSATPVSSRKSDLL